MSGREYSHELGRRFVFAVANFLESIKRKDGTNVYQLISNAYETNLRTGLLRKPRDNFATLYYQTAPSALILCFVDTYHKQKPRLSMLNASMPKVFIPSAP